MARTLLALVQQACSEINIPQPSALISSTDDQAIQLLALANREGKDFSHDLHPRRRPAFPRGGRLSRVLPPHARRLGRPGRRPG